MLYVFYITTTPYLPCNNKNIKLKELYDFYYTAITLTTGYKSTYSTIRTWKSLVCIDFSLYSECAITRCYKK